MPKLGIAYEIRLSEVRATRLIAAASLALLVLLMHPETVSEYSHGMHYDLYLLTIVAVIIVASAVWGSILGVTPAILEILLGFTARLSGLEPVETLELIAEIGGVFVMFTAGLEINVGALRRHFGSSIVIGSACFMAPFISSYLILTTILGLGHKSALIASAGLSTTGVAIVYSILRTLGYIRSVRGQVALASAMIADMFSVLFFALTAMRPGPLLLLYVLGIAVLPAVASKLARHIPPGMHELEIRLIVMLLLIISLFSTIAGVHAVLAAFIMGVVLGEIVRKRHVLEEKVQAITFGFLAPIFFVTAGMSVALDDPRKYIILVGVFLLASLPAKVAAAWVGLRAVVGLRDLKVAVVFAARLTVSTLIAYSGVKTGLLEPNVAGAIILSALIATTIAGLFSGRTAFKRVSEYEE